MQEVVAGYLFFREADSFNKKIMSLTIVRWDAPLRYASLIGAVS
jgi:hypothetical protein